MFALLQKLFLSSQPDGKKITLKIKGMHCTSCALNIDGELEELKGVKSATTRYAKAETVVVYDPELTTVKKINNVVEALGYQVIRNEPLS